MEHISVLLNESIEALKIKEDGIYVDATLGGGGHSFEILKRLTSGKLFSFDQDSFAITRCKERFKDNSNIEIIQSNFANIKDELAKRNIYKIDGILFDLGLSSFQIDDEDRGFSYLKNTKLDMRMNQDSDIDAHYIVNNYSKEDLIRIFREYGEEKNAYRIANIIVNNRPIETAGHLVRLTDIVNKDQKGHSAKRVFQALRIEVNQELDVLKKALVDALSLLNEGGLLVVITFHSLEDRIVKHFIVDNSTVNVPKNLIIQNMPKAILTNITKKPILPSDNEIASNSRAHSAKLRVAMKNESS